MRRNNPFEEIERMFERMSKQFEDLPRAEMALTNGVDVDVEDRADEYVVTADLPGFSKEDIEVELADQTLRIAAETEAEAETEEPGR
ncbi:MAG: Hsp20/alpha crystallin family protein, partial [Haloplanus sp.]